MRKDLSHLEHLRLAAQDEAAAAIDVTLGATPGTAEGRYLVKVSPSVALQIMASELFGWDRVSVIAKELDHRGREVDAKAVRAPTFWELCHARRMFFEDWEPVFVEIPPPNSDNHAKIAYLQRIQPGQEATFGPQGEQTALTPGQAKRYQALYDERPKNEH